MATREENLKKINDELEKLTDEELDDVAGGKLWGSGWGLYKINDKKASAQQNQNNSTKNIFYDRP